MSVRPEETELASFFTFSVNDRNFFLMLERDLRDFSEHTKFSSGGRGTFLVPISLCLFLYGCDVTFLPFKNVYMNSQIPYAMKINFVFSFN